MWKKLSSKIILDHKRIKVVEDEVELPNGHKTDYVRFEVSGCAPLAIVINNDNQILLSQEYSYPTNEVIYQFPGGFVSNSENVEEGLKRELMEEVGYLPSNLQYLRYFYNNDRRNNMKTIIYLASQLTEQKLEGDYEESIETKWVSEMEIDQMIKDNKIRHGASLAAWAMYKSIN
jgi:ADP-ribose pyrophosphatase